MVSKRVVAALFLSQMLAGVAFAQSVVAPAGPAEASVAAPDEFGRVSGGELDLLAKHSSRFSGSFGILTSRSQFPFATRNGTTTGYNATLGGTIVQDRLWFFASGYQSDALLGSRFDTALPQTRTPDVASRAINPRVSAQLGDRQSLAASFIARRDAGATPTITTAAPGLGSLLSLHYTGIVSSNMFFTANVSRRSAVQPELQVAPVIQPQ